MKITDFLTPEMIEPSLKGQTKVESSPSLPRV